MVAVAAVSGSPSWRELYGVGANGKVAHRWKRDGHPWHDWYPARFGGTARDIALTSPLRGQLEAFVVAADGDIWHRWYVDRKWSDWGSLGRPADRSPSQAVTGTSYQEKHQEIFVMGTDGDLSHRWHWQGNPWDPWYSRSAPQGTVVDIAVAAPGPGRLHVLVLDDEGSLWQRTYHPQHWSDWERVG
ncbi:hypothetical protein [Actinoplanes sp. NPDC023714]|uniref:hypothetical protein n=1 Tax=Actinoplanes sp. NPDC023714 TaxID=3154322 RepID=UPI003410BE8F